MVIFGPPPKSPIFRLFQKSDRGCQISSLFFTFFQFLYFLKIIEESKRVDHKKGSFLAHFLGPKTGHFQFFQNVNIPNYTHFRCQKVGSLFEQVLEKTDFFVFLTTFFHFLNFCYTLFRPFLLNNVLIYESVIFTILSDFTSKFCHFLIHFWINSGNSLFFTIFGSFLDTFLKFIDDSIKCKI